MKFLARKLKRRDRTRSKNITRQQTQFRSGPSERGAKVVWLVTSETAIYGRKLRPLRRVKVWSRGKCYKFKQRMREEESHGRPAGRKFIAIVLLFLPGLKKGQTCTGISWFRFTLILSVPPSAWFCRGWCKIGRTGWKILDQSQLSEQMPFPVHVWVRTLFVQTWEEKLHQRYKFELGSL